jgi:hypothetical protein
MKMKRTRKEIDDKEVSSDEAGYDEPSENKKDIMADIEKQVTKINAEKQEVVKPVSKIEQKPIEQQQPVETKKKPVYEIINEKAIEFNYDMKKVQDYAIVTLTGENLFSAGFQVCLIMTNNRLQVENVQRNYLKSILDGNTEIPFDPRQPTILSKVMLSLLPMQRTEVKQNNQDVLNEIKKLVENKK